MKGLQKRKLTPKLPVYVNEIAGASRIVKVERWKTWGGEFLASACWYELTIDITGTIQAIE